MRRQLLVLLSCLLVFVGVLFAPSATADSPPLGNARVLASLRVPVAELAVAESQNRVFAAAREAGLVAISLDGTRQKVNGVERADVIASDGAAIWVASGELPDQVTSVDVETLATTIWPMPGVCARDLAVSGGLVWVLDRCDSYGDARLWALDPATGAATSVATIARDQSMSLTASPLAPGILLVAHGGTLSEYRVAAGPPPTADEVASVEADGFAAAITPSGTAITIDGLELSLDGLASIGAMGSRGLPAVRDDGLVAFHSYETIDVRTAEGAMFHRYFTYDGHYQVQPVAFGARDLYTVNPTSNGHYQVVAITPRAQTKLLVDVPRTSGRKRVVGDQVPVTVTMKGGLGERVVALYAIEYTGKGRNLEEHRRLVGRGTIGADGSWSTSFRLGAYTVLEAVYEGDDTNDPASAQAEVKAKAKVELSPLRSVARRGGVYQYRVGSNAVVGVRVLPNLAGDCADITGLIRDRSGWHLLEGVCARLDARSRGAFYMHGYPEIAGHLIKFRAKAGGDWSRADWAYSPWVRIQFVR